jgi:hypothetical protein
MITGLALLDQNRRAPQHVPKWRRERAFSGQNHRGSGELCGFDLRGHVLSIIWGALWSCP